MIFDFIFLSLFIISFIIGYKIGFLRFILNITSLFTGFIISVVLVKPVSYYILNTNIGSSIIVFFTNKLNNIDFFQSISDDTPLQEFILQLGFPNFISKIVEIILVNFDISNSTVIYSLSFIITKIIISILCFIFLWIIFSTIIILLKIISNLIRKLFIIKIIDGAIGVTISTTIYLIISFILSASIYYLGNFHTLNNVIRAYINQQHNTSLGLYRYFIDNNFIITLIELLSNN